MRRAGGPWLKFRAQGALWRVYLVDRGTDILEDCEGVTRNREHEVLIDESLSPARRIAVLGHELVHIMFTHANAELMAAVLHCSKESVPDAEEALASYAGPTLGEVLVQLVTQMGGRA